MVIKKKLRHGFFTYTLTSILWFCRLEFTTCQIPFLPCLKFQESLQILRDCNIPFSYSSQCFYIKYDRKFTFPDPLQKRKKPFTKTWLFRLPVTTGPLDLPCNWYLSCTSNKMSFVTHLQTIILPNTNDNGYSVMGWG